jgi:hypothetical protein
VMESTQPSKYEDSGFANYIKTHSTWSYPTTAYAYWICTGWWTDTETLFAEQQDT